MEIRKGSSMHIGAPSRSNGSARLLGGAVVRAMLVLAVGSAGLAWLAWPSSQDGANAASTVAAAPKGGDPAPKPAAPAVQAALASAAPPQASPVQVASLPQSTPPAVAAPRSLFQEPARQVSLPQSLPLRPSPPPPDSAAAFAAPAPSSPQGSQALPDAPLGASRSLAVRAPAAPVKAAPGPLTVEFPKPERPPAPQAAPAAVQDKVAAVAPPPAGTSSGLVNLNTATIEQLNAIDGAGPVARAIMRGRPYASAEDLVTKRILRRSVYERIKDQVTVR
jgi:helix-hairpin-helix protein